MNHKMLIAAFAGLSLVAAAQSTTNKQKTETSSTQAQSKDAAKDQRLGNKSAQDDWQQTAAKPASGSSQTKAPRDVASGQATGRRQHQPITITKEVDKASTRVATGDVNGDGAPDVAASKNSAHATESATSTASGSSNVQGSRDAASGQMAGKRQHQPMTVKKDVDKATPLLKQ